MYDDILWLTNKKQKMKKKPKKTTMTKVNTDMYMKNKKQGENAKFISNNNNTNKYLLGINVSLFSYCSIHPMMIVFLFYLKRETNDGD